MWDEQSIVSKVYMFLPVGAELLASGGDDGSKYVYATDVDGDGVPEIVGYYEWQGENYLLLLKNSPSGWKIVVNAKRNDNWIQQVRYQLRKRTVNLYPASVKTKEGTFWGYINESGQFVIPARFTSANDFQDNGLAIVQVKDRSGVINRAGQFVILPKYESITQFSDGRAGAIDDKGFWMIDEKGTILTQKPYSYIGIYQDGRAVAANNTPQGKYLYGYLDGEGKEVIPLQFEAANDFSEGQAVVQLKANEYALIDRNGTRLRTFPYASLNSPSEGLMAFRPINSELYGYVDTEGKVVVPPKYSMALPFENGRAIVNASTDFTVNKFGLIDKQGTYLIKPEYNDIQMLGEERVAVGRAKDSKQPYLGSIYAVADTQGRFLTDFIYQNVMSYQDGYASASANQTTFFIDRSGKKTDTLPTFQGMGTATLEGKLIKTDIDQRVTYYDRNGRIVYQQNTVIPLQKPYRVIEKKYNPNQDYFVYYPQVEGMSIQTAQDKVNRQLREMSQIKKIDSNAQLDYSYSGDFSVEFFKEHLLELQLTGYNFPFGAAHGMPTMVYAIIDLQGGRFFQLKDLFRPNSNYVQVLSDIIGQQIKTDPQYSYVFPDSYKGIQPDQPFYVKEDALYIYFSPYEIAPYAAGFPTFRIPFAQIMNIINVNGAFWKSFH
ncbi:WG repeat-containing protein [Brevibacillus sp. SYSU BS000544]|uniref:WG repeat-containing protein n=1 Tax=Brevibacillus sp. SYSU BS000544 TaxID=3416443 RepID=UPI003CE5B51D